MRHLHPHPTPQAREALNALASLDKGRSPVLGPRVPRATACPTGGGGERGVGKGDEKEETGEAGLFEALEEEEQEEAVQEAAAATWSQGEAVQEAAAVGPDRNVLLRARRASSGGHRADHARLEPRVEA